MVARFLSAAMTLLLLLGAQRSFAQPRAAPDVSVLARSLFEQGLAEVEQGDFATASALFSQSEGLSPRTSTLLNLAIVQVKLGRFDDALRTLDRLEVGTPTGSETRQLERAQELRREVLRMFGLVRLTVIPQHANVRIDARYQPPPVDYLKLAPGQHELHVSLAGFLEQRVPITVHTGERLALDITLHPTTATTSSEGTLALTSTQASCEGARGQPTRREPPTARWSRLQVALLVVGAVLIAGTSSAITLSATN